MQAVPALGSDVGKDSQGQLSKANASHAKHTNWQPADVYATDRIISHVLRKVGQAKRSLWHVMRTWYACMHDAFTI